VTRFTAPAFGLLCIALASGAGVSRAAAEETPTFTLRDTRPAEDKKTYHHSLMITSCNYGVRRIGDADISPPPLEQLRASLAASLGEGIAGKEIEVRRYHLDVNTAAHTRGRMKDEHKGLVADVMLGMGAGCAREKMEAGWFEASEVSTANAPLIVEMQIVVDGQALDVRSVYSPDIAWEPRVWRPESRASVNAALAAANAKLAEALRGASAAPANALPSSGGPPQGHQTDTGAGGAPGRE
jgi:hypothetical protein